MLAKQGARRACGPGFVLRIQLWVGIINVKGFVLKRGMGRFFFLQRGAELQEHRFDRHIEQNHTALGVRALLVCACRSVCVQRSRCKRSGF